MRACDFQDCFGDTPKPTPETGVLPGVGMGSEEHRLEADGTLQSRRTEEPPTLKGRYRQDGDVTDG
ncbi:MAG: hypothetical protein ACJ8M1_03325 [Chthoniobacterales bacterium]